MDKSAAENLTRRRKNYIQRVEQEDKRMLDISKSMGRLVYQMLIPQTPEDDRRIAEDAKKFPEIAGSRMSAISDGRTYRVVESMVHERDSNQLHLVHLVRQP
jgi:hypothetical protein